MFSAPMVRALLAGTKTQTRRVVSWPFEKPSVVTEVVPSLLAHRGDLWDARRDMDNPVAIRCPYGAPGDRLWCKESHGIATGHMYDGLAAVRYDAGGEVRAIDDERSNEQARSLSLSRRRPSIHMPRWASRITLEVTEVRVQRLQDISEEDARAEGAPAYWEVPLSEEPGSAQRLANALASGGASEPGSHVTGYRTLWDSINGQKAPWSSNPWCWAISFKRLP